MDEMQTFEDGELGKGRTISPVYVGRKGKGDAGITFYCHRKERGAGYYQQESGRSIPKGTL